MSELYSAQYLLRAGCVSVYDASLLFQQFFCLSALIEFS